MAGFCTKTFTKHDNYMTPKSAWEQIQQYIPRNKVLWEAFYGDGKSGTHLQELGFETIHEDIDFFQHNVGDIVVSNPPFSHIKQILTRLVLELDKPFILIMPVSKLNAVYFQTIMKDKTEHLQLIVPRTRIQFIKDGIKKENRCNFDCLYYCYKIGLDKSIIFLDKPFT
jgi:hypothetical protein